MPTLAAWLHDLDPFAIRFGDDFGIRWYGLSYLVGFFLGYLLVKRVAKVGISTLKPEHAGDFIVTVAIGIVTGGRLGYCLFYQPWLFASVDWVAIPALGLSVPVWSALALWDGGMSSHGGMIGGILAAWYFAWRYGHDLPFLLDLFAFGAPLGLFFGRIANFLNGELFGRATDVAWAVKFPQEMYEWGYGKLQGLARALEATGVNSVAEPRAYDRGVPDVPWIIEQIQAGNQRIITAVEPLLTARHPSQLYAAVMEGLIVFAVLLWVWRVPRKPGVVGSWFCITYALMRIADEFFRRPDMFLLDNEFAATRETIGLGISRGQWLSLLLLFVGLWGLWFSRRRQKPGPMGGWRKPRKWESEKARN